MADDWDLYAIVRSCSSAAAVNRNTNRNAIENGNSGNHLDCLASLTFDDEDDPFSFPDLAEPRINGWQELQDSYKPFLPTSTSSGQGNIPISSSIYDVGEFICGQNQPQLAQPQHHHHHQQQLALASPPQPPPITSNVPFSFRFNNIQQQAQHAQQKLHHHQQNSQSAETCSTVLPLRTTAQSSLPSRSRKKKSNLKRQVMQVTAENLCNDVWAWRKYGQKPIKGSPYPRNYYRCSSSKGCTARKQVERSNIDPNMFIVSYTGEHTHPRPTHRNSLAGSTRNKFPSVQKLAASTSGNKLESDDNQASGEKAAAASPLSATSLSPTTPLSAASMDHEGAAVLAPHESIISKSEAAANYTEEADVEGHRIMESDENEDFEIDDDEEDDDILIPNMTLNEDLIKGLQELGTVGEAVYGGLATATGSTSSNNTRSRRPAAGLGHSPVFGDNFSSWAVGSSASAAGASGGGG